VVVGCGLPDATTWTIPPIVAREEMQLDMEHVGSNLLHLKEIQRTAENPIEGSSNFLKFPKL
jgi:hypothetical protein